MKTALKIAGLMNAATLLITLVLMVKFIIEGNTQMALLCLIAHGVWCCSISLNEINTRQGDA